jgi:hypothetical protein
VVTAIYATVTRLKAAIFMERCWNEHPAFTVEAFLNKLMIVNTTTTKQRVFRRRQKE